MDIYFRTVFFYITVIGCLLREYSGLGRCSIAAALPVISMLKVQCSPVPISIFSNHTGFPSFFFDDYTPKMELYIQE